MFVNTQNAKDVIQESFVSAFKHLKTFKGKASFGSWLKRIVINKSIDFKSAYELKLDVSKTEKSLENFSGYFKYSYVEMPLDKDVDIRIDIDINRGKLIYDSKSFPKIEEVGTRKVLKEKTRM